MSNESKAETTENFAEMYEKSLKSIEVGQKIKGTVISVSSKSRDLFVDIGYKADGVVPFTEFSYDPTELPEEVYKPGDEIECVVLKTNDGEGNVLLTRKRVDLEGALDELEKAFNEKTVVNGVVERVVNGGVMANVKGIRVFVPASLLSDRKIDDLNTFLKQKVELQIIECDKEKKRFIGSQREILNKRREEAKKKIWDNIEVGQKVTGTVKSITNFGAFVDIGGQDAMVHISELSWRKVKHPSELLSVGQTISATVIAVDKEKGKISLTYKNPEDDPWKRVAENYKVGDVVKGKVVEMLPFGAFVELQDGAVGLVHISQISRKRINHPQEVLAMGEEVEAKVIEVDTEKKKLGLSIKEVLPIEE